MSYFSSSHTNKRTTPQTHTPSAAQVENDRAQMEAWLKKHPATKLPPATADNAASIYVPIAATAKPRRTPAS